MRKSTKIFLWAGVLVVLYAILQYSPTSQTQKVFSPDRQYSVFSYYKNKQLYEYLFPAFSGNLYFDVETILYDEEADSVICYIVLGGEGGFIPDNGNVSFK